MTARNDCQWNPQRVACQGLKFLWGKFFPSQHLIQGRRRNACWKCFLMILFCGRFTLSLLRTFRTATSPGSPFLFWLVQDNRADCFFLTPNVPDRGGSPGVTILVYLPSFCHYIQRRVNEERKTEPASPSLLFLSPHHHCFSLPGLGWARLG